jgi:hypothetical protein
MTSKIKCLDSEIAAVLMKECTVAPADAEIRKDVVAVLADIRRGSEFKRARKFDSMQDSYLSAANKLHDVLLRITEHRQPAIETLSVYKLLLLNAHSVNLANMNLFLRLMRNPSSLDARKVH